MIPTNRISFSPCLCVWDAAAHGDGRGGELLWVARRMHRGLHRGPPRHVPGAGEAGSVSEDEGGRRASPACTRRRRGGECVGGYGVEDLLPGMYWRGWGRQRRWGCVNGSASGGIVDGCSIRAFPRPRLWSDRAAPARVGVSHGSHSRSVSGRGAAPLRPAPLRPARRRRRLGEGRGGGGAAVAAPRCSPSLSLCPPIVAGGAVVFAGRPSDVATYLEAVLGYPVARARVPLPALLELLAQVRGWITVG